VSQDEIGDTEEAIGGGMMKAYVPKATLVKAPKLPKAPKPMKLGLKFR